MKRILLILTFLFFAPPAFSSDSSGTLDQLLKTTTEMGENSDKLLENSKSLLEKTKKDAARSDEIASAINRVLITGAVIYAVAHGSYYLFKYISKSKHPVKSESDVPSTDIEKSHREPIDIAA